MSTASKPVINGLENEPNEPIIKTEIPGPNSLALTNDLGKIIVITVLLFLN